MSIIRRMLPALALAVVAGVAFAAEPVQKPRAAPKVDASGARFGDGVHGKRAPRHKLPAVQRRKRQRSSTKLNPQPEPPSHPGDKVTINPQPEPPGAPRNKRPAVQTPSGVTPNPGGKIKINPQPEPPG